MRPRWTRSHPESPRDRFIGYAEEFDLYIATRENGQELIWVVASKDTYPKTNFDAFEAKRGALHSLRPVDLHVTPYHMCLIYAAAIEHGLLKQEES